MSDLDDPGPRPDPTLPPGRDPVSAPAGPPAAEPDSPGDYPVPAGYTPGGYTPGGYPPTGNFGKLTSWPPVAPVAPEPPAVRREWPIGRADLVWAAVWALVPVVAGLVLAFVWHALGPHVEIVMTAIDQPDLTDYNTEAFVAGDGRYAVLTGIAGVVTGALAWLLRRGRGPLLVIALAAGSLGGAFLTWKLGTHLGEAEYRHLFKTAVAGTHFSQNMQLRAEGLVYLEPLAAVAVFVGCAAWSRYPDLTPSAHHEPLPAYPPPPEYSDAQ